MSCFRVIRNRDVDRCCLALVECYYVYKRVDLGSRVVVYVSDYRRVYRCVIGVFSDFSVGRIVYRSF